MLGVVAASSPIQKGSSLDTVAISEEVGAVKPDPEIFQYAPAELGVRKATMIGDSRERDVPGATGSGMEAIRLNRYRRPCPDPSLAVEIGGFEPVERILHALNTSSNCKGR